MFEIALEILHILGGKSYIVGGSVRDIIMGLEPDDIDIATDVPMDVIESMFKTHDIGKNKEFGIVVVNYKGHDFEIAGFRSDGEYSDGRRPDSIKTGVSFEEDTKRRDFTINAMGMDKDKNIIDFHNGQTDIKHKIITSVGNPEKRFSEDYIRMLRAIRFASRFGFSIDLETSNAISNNAHKIVEIAPERIMKEVNKMASGNTFYWALRLMKESGLLKYIFPEIDKMDKYEHHPATHPEGGVWEHVLEAIRVANSNDRLVNLSILFHDVGKPVTRAYKDRKGERTVCYFAHESVGAKMIPDICERLKIDNDTKDAMVYCAKNHMKMHKFLEMSTSKCYKLTQSKYWETLLKVSLADGMSRMHLFNEDEWSKIMNKIATIEEKYQSEEAKQQIKKSINGNVVMKLRPGINGPEIGRIIRATIDWMLNNNININDRTKIDNFIKQV